MQNTVAVSNYFSSNSGYRYYQFALDDKTITAADMSLITVEGDGSDKNDPALWLGQYTIFCTAVWAMIT